MFEPTGVPMPDRAATRMPPIRHVPFNLEVKVLLINPTYHRWEMHHDPEIPPYGRDVPCQLDDDCPYCRPGDKLQPARLTGWIGALGRKGPANMLGRIVLAMPFLLCHNLNGLLDKPNGLRGLELTLFRGPSKRNDSVTITDVMAMDEPPLQSFDVIPTLENAWNLPGFFARQTMKDRNRRFAAARGVLNQHRAAGSA